MLCSFSEPVCISSYLLISEKQKVSGMMGFVYENSSDAVCSYLCLVPDAD